MRSLLLVAGVLLLSACVKSAPVPDPASIVVDAGVTEADVIAPKVDAIEKEILSIVQATDESLWKSWTTGNALDLGAASKGHDALFSKATLELLARAKELRPAEVGRIDSLSRWLIGELLVRGVAVESEAIANLEASLTFLVDGKEFPWRDLGKTLVFEKSAVKRHAIWKASHESAARLEPAIAAREKKATEVLASLGLPGPLEYAAQSRGFTLESLWKQADGVLTATEDEWRKTLQELSDAEVKLPVTGLTRGDLPRVLKVPTPIDSQFPKQKIATRLVQTLGTLGVYGKPGLTLDLAEAAKKNPLPLTVAPTRGDVRVSIRPLGGMRDQQLALAEVGAALELSTTGNRLAAPLDAQVRSERFASLLTEKAWLEANEVTLVDAVIAAAKAQRLFTLRRAAGLVLARLEAAKAADDTAARSAFVLAMTRAMGMPLPPEEGARWRLETDDFLRSATQLEAMTRAAAIQEPAWWVKTPPSP